MASRRILWVLPPVIVVAMVIAVVLVINIQGDRLSAERGTTRAGEPDPVGEVSIDAPIGGLLPARDWPDACRLLTEHDITAVLPEAAEVQAAQFGVSTRTVEEFLADPKYRDDEYSPNGRCTYAMRLPGERVNSLTTVQLRLIAVGDPELIGRYHHNQQLGRGAGVGGLPRPSVDECYLSDLYGTDQICRRGPVMFEVGGSTTVVFRDFGGFSFWRDQVLPRFATSVGAKLRWNS